MRLRALVRCSDARRRGAQNRETCRRFTPGFTFQPISRNETFRNFDFRAVEPPIRYPVSQTAAALNCSQANRFALLKYLVLHLVSQNRCCGRYRLNTLPHSTQSCVRLFVFWFAISRSPFSSPCPSLAGLPVSIQAYSALLRVSASAFRSPNLFAFRNRSANPFLQDCCTPCTLA